MSGKPQTRPVSDLFAGAGMGLLLGTVMGLTTQPVVAVVVGALASLLGVFMGLDGSGSEEGRALRVNGTRIGALGLCAVIGFGLGLYVRINNPLAAPPAQQLARWAEAFPDDPTLAKQMMVYERTGIRPAAFTYGKAAPSEPVETVLDEGKASAASSVLFSTLSEYDVCSRVDPKDYASAADVLEIYDRRSAPDILKRLKPEIEALPPSQRDTAVAVAHDLLCILQEQEQP